MALTKLDKDMEIIKKLDPEPNDVGGMTATEFQTKFDEGGIAVKDYINDTLTSEIESQFATKLEIEAKADKTDVYTKAETSTAFATKTDLLNAQVGTIPEGSITDIYLSNAPGEIKDTINTHLADNVTQFALKADKSILDNHLVELVTDTDGVHGLKIESGTFTPSLIGGTTPGSCTYSTRDGSYKLIGNLCHFDISIVITAKGSMSGVAVINGLPFPASTSNLTKREGTTVSNIAYVTLTSGYTQFVAQHNPNDNYIYLRSVGSNVTHKNITNTEITNTSEIRLSGMYEIA